jgi:hypothetical protein
LETPIEKDETYKSEIGKLRKLEANFTSTA